MKVYCLNKISPVGLKAFPKQYEISNESIDDASVVMVRSAAMHEMKLPESVLCVARAGAGVNNIPLETYAKDGVVVFNTPGANANAVKELTIAMMLLAARDIRGSMEWVKANKEDENINKTMEKAKSSFAGNEIYGKTLGIIGCGAIGALVADAAIKLGMRVLGVEPSEATKDRYRDLLKGVEFVDYDELFKSSDYITLHVPLLDSTRGMINSETLSLMKDGVVILNPARDALVNDDDMAKALLSGKVKRYVTDFPNHKSANMDGVIAISHLGASTEEAEDNCAYMASNEIVNFIENGNIINSVNYPRIDLGVKEHCRILILHEASVSSNSIVETISPHRTILKMANGIKNQFGATLLEVVDKGEHVCVCSILKSIEGVIRVRPIK